MQLLYGREGTSTVEIGGIGSVPWAGSQVVVRLPMSFTSRVIFVSLFDKAEDLLPLTK